MREDILNSTSTSILLEYATGYGKSKLAIEYSLKYNSESILIVIPRLLFIDNWNEEFIKWGYEQYLKKVTFVTYISFPKINKTDWDCIIYDECHHLSERCRKSLYRINSKINILLSATVPRNLKREFSYLFPDLEINTISSREAIEDNVLPDPKVYLIPLDLDRINPKERLIKNPKGKTTIECNYIVRWNYIRDKNKKVIIKCTERQYVNELNSEINYWKSKYLESNKIIVKNKWLQLCSQRLVYLSNLKNGLLLEIQKKFKDYKMLTFCNSIEQTELLGKNCINSKNKASQDILDSFNSNKIKHITACNMLNEGINLTKCKICLYGNLNSSDTIITQRLGRALRHENPVIIIPYYINTREEEILNKMLESYNPELITKTTDIKDIIL